MRQLWLILVCSGTICAATDPGLARLEQQIDFVARTTDAVVGVNAVHIESGRTVAVRGAESFPMASAFKLPVAVQMLSMIDDRKVTLDRMVSLIPSDLHPGSGRITDLFFHPGISISL